MPSLDNMKQRLEAGPLSEEEGVGAMDGDINATEMRVLHDLLHRRLDELEGLAKSERDEVLHQEFHALQNLHDKLFDA